MLNEILRQNSDALEVGEDFTNKMEGHRRLVEEHAAESNVDDRFRDFSDDFDVEADGVGDFGGEACGEGEEGEFRCCGDALHDVETPFKEEEKDDTSAAAEKGGVVIVVMLVVMSSGR